MFELLWQKIRLILADANLRGRLLFLLGALFVFRLGATIPIPGVNREALASFLSGSGGQFFGLLNIFSGGGLSNLSIMMLGVSPFITASIIMQLGTLIFPWLKEMYHEEGEAGRRKVAQYSRFLTVPLAALQGFGLMFLLEKQQILGPLTLTGRLINLVVIVSGSVLLMWIGELISEYGLGNGTSLIIFAGIVSRLPRTVNELLLNFDQSQIPLYIGFLVLLAIVIWGVVIMTEAERPVPVTYAKRVRGNKLYGGMDSYLPIRVNNAGVMPIIFALSILLFPQMIVNFLSTVTQPIVQAIIGFAQVIINNQWIYGVLYFVLVFVFTYFYSAVTFDPEMIAENLQKSGAFIPGVRPGRPTAENLSRVLTRLTLLGATFLGLVALLPLVLRGLTGIAGLAIGGTSLLIVVSVAIDFIKQINAQLSMREY